MSKVTKPKAGVKHIDNKEYFEVMVKGSPSIKKVFVVKK